MVSVLSGLGQGVVAVSNALTTTTSLR